MGSYRGVNCPNREVTTIHAPGTGRPRLSFHQRITWQCQGIMASYCCEVSGAPVLDSAEDVLEEWVGEGDTRWNVRRRGESAS